MLAFSCSVTDCVGQLPAIGNAWLLNPDARRLTASLFVCTGSSACLRTCGAILVQEDTRWVNASSLQGSIGVGAIVEELRAKSSQLLCRVQVCTFHVE